MTARAAKPTTLGALLRDRREQLGLTLREMGRRIGCSHAYVREMEVGIRPVSVRVLPDLARELGLDLALLKSCLGPCPRCGCECRAGRLP